MDTPNNHLTGRAKHAPLSHGHVPSPAPLWPLVMLGLIMWAISLTAMVALGLPFLQWLTEHVRIVP
jgi:hypothetical protein